MNNLWSSHADFRSYGDEPSMKMRTKAFIVVAVLTITTFLVLHGLANFVLLSSFATLEEQETRKSVMRTTSTLMSELSDLDSKVTDWAFWDDTYRFVQDLNEDYVALNLADSTFANLRLNLMLFVSSLGQIIHAKAFDLTTQTETLLPSGLSEHIASHSLLWNYSSEGSETIGFISIPEGSVMIASKPILTSQDEGPIEGALIFGRYLDSREIGYLSQMAGFSVTVGSVGLADLPTDFKLAYSKMSDSSMVSVQPVNSDVIAGYALTKDVYGNPAFILRVDSSRDIYQQGLNTVNYFLYSSAAICIIFSGGMMMSLERGVVYPLSRITSRDQRNGQKLHRHPYQAKTRNR